MDLYWTVDQVQLVLAADEAAWARGEALLRVSLRHSMPNLAKLLLRFDNGPWVEHEDAAAVATWALQPGKNSVWAKGVNTFGREGATSRVMLRYHPRWTAAKL
jgi:hypothetical protein